MGVTSRLIYDPTDADSRAASSRVGSLVLTGIDATPIGHETLDSVDWLRVTGPIIDSAGNAVTVTGGKLDVNIAGGFVDLDDDLADTAIENTATAVSAVAVNLVTSALPSRKHLGLSNEGNKSLYFGKTGVTAVNGFPLHPGMQQVWRIGPSVTPQIIGGAGASSEDLRVIELS